MNRSLQKHLVVVLSLAMCITTVGCEISSAGGTLSLTSMGYLDGYYFGYVDAGGYDKAYGVVSFGYDDGYYDGYEAGYEYGSSLPVSGRRSGSRIVRSPGRGRRTRVIVCGSRRSTRTQDEPIMGGSQPDSHRPPATGFPAAERLESDADLVLEEYERGQELGADGGFEAGEQDAIADKEAERDRRARRRQVGGTGYGPGVGSGGNGGSTPGSGGHGSGGGCTPMSPHEKIRVWREGWAGSGNGPRADGTWRRDD